MKNRVMMLCVCIGLGGLLAACGPMVEGDNQGLQGNQLELVKPKKALGGKLQEGLMLAPSKKPSSFDPRELPKLMLPGGVWSGRLSQADKGERTFTLRIMPKGQQTARWRRPVKRAWWQRLSLFRKAHACGPYGGGLQQAAIGQLTFSEDSRRYGQVQSFRSEGTISSFDGARSFSVSLRSEEGFLLGASAMVDQKTGVLQLQGTLFHRTAEKQPYVKIGTFLATKVEQQ